MAIRVPWDKAETALLIDVYLRIEAGQLPMQEAVSVLSHQLRYRAMKAGIKIDEVFRNENEIRMRLGEIQFLMTGGKLGFRNGLPPIFVPTCELVKTVSWHPHS